VIKLARRKTLDILASIFLTQLFVPLSLAGRPGVSFTRRRVPLPNHRAISMS